MSKIDTILRLWCPNCQAPTPSEDCSWCAAPGLACAVCHRCAIHGDQSYCAEED